LHLLEEGISVSDNILRKILRSPNQVETYNPIAEYFESLNGKYKGVSHIDLLMSHLRLREYPGYGRNYFQTRMYRYMKKWFVAAAACALGKHPNDVAMGLVHSEEGIGKTYFFEYIIPEPLRNLVADPKEDGKFNMEESFATNFNVHFDEMTGISRRSTEMFKKVMSAREIDVYLPREPYPIRRKRIGNATFTSNKIPEKGGFLTSAMGYRRWLVFELDTINQEYSKKVDIDQLWAEALMLIEQDFDFKWNTTDWNEFKEQNRRYLEETTSMKYVKMYFEIPSNGDGSWLQPREILNLLVSTRRVRKEDMQRISDVKIGEALSALNFPDKKVRKSEGPRKCYYVKEIV
jgi:predicted P-loop ATPase